MKRGSWLRGFASFREQGIDGPPPTSGQQQKSQVISCAYSERISCSTAQKPTRDGTGGNGSAEVPRYSGIFVDAIAT
jgi:hypothetical protein